MTKNDGINYGKKWFLSPDHSHPWVVMVEPDNRLLDTPPVEIATIGYRPFAQLLVDAGNAKIAAIKEHGNG